MDKRQQAEAGEFTKNLLNDNGSEEALDTEIPEYVLFPHKAPFRQKVITVALKFLKQTEPGEREIALIVRGGTITRPVKLLKESSLSGLPPELLSELKALETELNAQKAEPVTDTLPVTRKEVTQSKAAKPAAKAKNTAPPPPKVKTLFDLL